jgi:sterol 14-demethylase
MPVPGTLAAPSKDRAYIIPKGHYVLASPAVSQLDPEFWKNPREFDPYRWTDPEGMAAQASKEYDDAEGEKIDYGFGAVSKGTESPYQPFGAGRHRCIGEQFAYLQLGVILSTFVRKMEMKLEKKFPAENFHVSLIVPYLIQLTLF